MRYERAKFYKAVYDLRPWFHDFSSLGIQTNFGLKNFGPRGRFKQVLSSIRRGHRVGFAPFSHVNQRSKEEFILPYLRRAIAELKEKGVTKPSFLELFCSDGFYSFWMKKYCEVGSIVGVDNDEKAIKQALLAKQILSFNEVKFRCEDVFDISAESKTYDVILCAGGLYHIPNPQELLGIIRKKCKYYLILQSVVTLETEEEDYFTAPAPGWKHGCRFTDAKLRSWITELGWEIIDHARNELQANHRPVDRGSTYYLLKPKADDYE